MKTLLLMCLIWMFEAPAWAQEGYPMDVPVDPPAQAQVPVDPAYYAGVPQAPVAQEQIYAESAPQAVEEPSALDMLYYDSGDDGSSDNASSLVNGLNF